MLIRFTTCLAGADFVRNPGDVAELPDAEAKRLIAAGFAAPAKSAEQIETATLPAQKVERATVRTRKGKAK